MSKYVANSACFSSKSVDWRTPEELYHELDKEFHFDFDPCPFKSGDKTGLIKEWGINVYCNPPYDNIYRFISKALYELKKNTKVVVFLLPSRTDSKWFHELVLPNYDEIRLVRGRIKFDGKNNAPFPSCIIVFKKKNNRLSN